MKKGTLGRRQLLKGLGAAGLFFPLLPSLQIHAEPKTPTKRLVLFFSANGTIPDAWVPSGTETNFKFGTILSPLETYKKKLLIIEGLGLKAGGPGDAHQQGMGQLFTGAPLLPGTTKGGCKTCAPVSWASNISLDQHIANHLLAEAKQEGRNVPLRSLELGVQATGSNIWTRMCYRGPKLPLPPNNDPYQLYKDLFSAAQTDKAKLEALRTQRKSVLDAVKNDLTRLKTELNSNDRQRLDEHLVNVREIERQLDSAAAADQCNPTPQGNPVPHLTASNFPIIGKLQMDMLAMALSCGLTQVGSIQWSNAVSNKAFTWLGIQEGHHSISHAGDSDGSAKSKLIKINKWYAEQFAYLLSKLEGVKEGNGTLLDNTIALWGNELGKGNSHTRNNIPFVMAGNVGGYFNTGRYLKYKDLPHNHLLVSISHAMGSAIDNFNYTKYRGPLSGLKA